MVRTDDAGVGEFPTESRKSCQNCQSCQTPTRHNNMPAFLPGTLEVGIVVDQTFFYQWTRLGNKVRKHRGFWSARRHRSVWCVSSILCLDVIVKSLEKRRKRKVDHISACSDKLSKKNETPKKQ